MFSIKHNMFKQLLPQAAAFLKQLEMLNAPPIQMVPTDTARDNYEKLSRYQGGIPISMARTEDRHILSLDGKRHIPIRIYWPVSKQLPLLLYFHGGGWSRGSLNTHDSLCRRLAKEAECIIVSVGYRLAPEDPYPAGLEDAEAAYMWCHKNALGIGANPNKIAIGGDSAGGNISAALTSCLIEKNSILPKFQLLIYPSLDLTFQHPSVELFGNGFFITKDALNYYAEIYVPDHNVTDWKISPLFYPKHHCLPSTIILNADCDPIRDDGWEYAKKLKASNVHVAHKNVPGVIHAFMQLIETFPLETAASYDWIALEMKKLW